MENAQEDGTFSDSKDIFWEAVSKLHWAMGGSSAPDMETRNDHQPSSGLHLVEFLEVNILQVA